MHTFKLIHYSSTVFFWYSKENSVPPLCPYSDSRRDGQQPVECNLSTLLSRQNSVFLKSVLPLGDLVRFSLTDVPSTSWKKVKGPPPKKWQRVPGVIVPTDGDMTWKDLWKAVMGVVMWDYFFKDDVDGTKNGHLPKMDVVSKSMMDSLMVSCDLHFLHAWRVCWGVLGRKHNRFNRASIEP